MSWWNPWRYKREMELTRTKCEGLRQQLAEDKEQATADSATILKLSKEKRQVEGERDEWKRSSNRQKECVDELSKRCERVIGERQDLQKSYDDLKLNNDNCIKLSDRLLKQRDEARSEVEKVQAAKDELWRDSKKTCDDLTAKWRKMESERNEAREERDRLSQAYDKQSALCNEKHATELKAQAKHATDMQRERDKARKSARRLETEKRSLILDRDEWKEQATNLRNAIAERPIVEVELYDSKQGRKAAPCMRFVGRHKGDVVAVSPPQGTPDIQHARKRIELLSNAKWVIVQRKKKGEA